MPDTVHGRLALDALLEKAVGANPEKVFLLYRQQRITYRQFSRQVAIVAGALRRGGIERGDRLAVMLPNRPEFLIAWFAAATIGAVEVPLNPTLRPRELRYLLKHSQARWIWVERSNAHRLTEIRGELQNLQRVVLVGDTDDGEPGSTEDDSWEQLLDEEPSSTGLDTVIVSPDDPVALLYTSGTTGRPKGVVLSHRSAVLTGESTAFMLGATSSDRIMTSNPLCHVNAQFHGVLTTLAAGASLVLLERFRRSLILEQAREYAASILLLAAAATTMMFSREPAEIDATTGIRTLLTGGVPAEIYDAFERRFQLRIQTAFAMTEAPVALMAPLSEMKRKPTPGVGTPMRHPDPAFRNEVQIVDDRGEQVSPLTRGEIRVRNPAVMTRYWNDPQGTHEFKREGWIRTGDLGYVDEDGYFFFVGRMSNVIRRRGELIAPAEIEAVLSQHAQVEESAVVGVPSGLGVGDEEMVAYVVTVAGAEVSPDELRQWCEQRLSPFKVPGTIVFRDDLPKTSLGKIQKGTLAASTPSLITEKPGPRRDVIVSND